MPDINGTSVNGRQVVMTLRGMTVANVQLLLTTQISAPPKKIGWIWVVAINNTAPRLNRVLFSGAVYTPGTYYAFTPDFGFVNVQYEMTVDWNVPGLPWLLRYA